MSLLAIAGGLVRMQRLKNLIASRLTPTRECIPDAIANDFANLIPASQRRTLLGIAQLIMLGELAVSRALDNLELPQ